MASEESKRCVAVFGASGLVGKELVSVALAKGMSVKGLYRPGSEPPTAKGLEIVTGQLTEANDVRRTLEGTIGAICVFGPRLKRGNDPDPFTADATAMIIAEMKNLRISRIVVQTGAMAGGDTPNWSWFVRRFVKSYRRNFPRTDKDRDAQELVTKNSDLDWTLVKPFRISGAKTTGRVRAMENLRISAFTHTPRADLAEFLLTELLDGSHHRKAVYVVK